MGGSVIGQVLIQKPQRPNICNWNIMEYLPKILPYNKFMPSLEVNIPITWTLHVGKKRTPLWDSSKETSPSQHLSLPCQVSASFTLAEAVLLPVGAPRCVLLATLRPVSGTEGLG